MSNARCRGCNGSLPLSPRFVLFSVYCTQDCYIDNHANNPISQGIKIIYLSLWRLKASRFGAFCRNFLRQKSFNYRPPEKSEEASKPSFASAAGD